MLLSVETSSSSSSEEPSHPSAFLVYIQKASLPSISLQRENLVRTFLLCLLVHNTQFIVVWYNTTSPDDEHDDDDDRIGECFTFTFSHFACIFLSFCSLTHSLILFLPFLLSCFSRFSLLLHTFYFS